MRATPLTLALCFAGIAAAAQAQAAPEAPRKNELTATTPITATPAAPREQAAAKPAPRYVQEGPFSVFTYEAIGATPQLQMGRSKAAAPQVDAVAAKK
jgi:hypothetical protein